MSVRDIPADVREFLREHVESYEQLEVLLIFSRAVDRAWSPGELAVEASVSPEAAREAVEHLSRVGVLAKSGAGADERFMPNAAYAGRIDRLVAEYRRDRLAVMNLMTSYALERVRTSALRAFTGAFLLGKKRDG